MISLFFGVILSRNLSRFISLALPSVFSLQSILLQSSAFSLSTFSLQPLFTLDTPVPVH